MPDLSIPEENERLADKALERADDASPDFAMYQVQRALVFELRAFRYQLDDRLERIETTLDSLPDGITEQLREIDASVARGTRG